MKKTFIIIAGLILFVSQISFAQENAADFFPGKWNVTIIGTPNGDAKFVLKVEKTEAALTAFIIGEDGKSTKVDRVETKPNAITVYWFAEGYDVNLTMTKKEDGKVEGDLMSMFTAKIEKVVE
jgi:hypothetical protein